jgi:hypothetical protein
VFATLDTEEYLDFQAARPTVELVDGVIREIQWPALAFSAGTLPGGGRDLVLLLGVEPNLRWPTFCDDVISVARTTGCELVVTLGALLGDVPHSRPMRCTGSATDEVLAAKLGMERSRYEGTYRNRRRAARRGATSRLRVRVDLGTGAALRRDRTEPKATRALLSRLSTLIDIDLDLSDLDIAASAWERSVDEVVAGDADASSYVERTRGPLRRVGRAGDTRNRQHHHVGRRRRLLDEDALPSGESLAEDFERYLREQGDD